MRSLRDTVQTLRPIVPRSSLNPLLHFGSVSAWLYAANQRAGGFVQHGASRVGPHYLRFLIRDGTDGESLLAAALARLPAEAMAAGVLIWLVDSSPLASGLPMSATFLPKWPAFRRSASPAITSAGLQVPHRSLTIPPTATHTTNGARKK